MWYAYSFTIDTDRASKDRALKDAVSAFSEAMLAHFNGEGYWVAASAPGKGGALEVWYSLPRLPAEKPFADFWRAQLLEHGLVATRVAGRA